MLPERFARWFASRGWSVRPHQLKLIEQAKAKRSTLLIAPTGAGKTLAGFLPSLIELAPEARDPSGARGLHTLYISPLKALAVDIARNLEAPAEEMALGLRLETRTGDTSASKRARQFERPPDILLTTPEQIALMVANREARSLFANVKRIVLDEVHSLVTSKRGDLLALDLARVRKLAPEATVVGLSATVRDPELIARYVASGGPDGASADIVAVEGGRRRSLPSSAARPGCRSRGIRRGMRCRRSTPPSRRTGRRWSSSTRGSRPSTCSRSSGAPMRTGSPSPSITARSTPSSVGVSRRR